MHGTVRRWDRDKGFGFIEAAHSRQVFFHIRDYRADTPPAEGMEVEYEEIQVGGKGPRAMQVRPRGAAPLPGPARPGPARPSRPRPPAAATARRAPQRSRPAPAQDDAPTGSTLAMALMLAWLALLAWGCWVQRLPWWLLGVLAGVNVATFFAYVFDKSAAQRGAWRTSEDTLHLLALLGGWPAAWWAQQWLRHKSRKAAFRAAYWGTVLLHSAALAVVVLRLDTLLIR